MLFVCLLLLVLLVLSSVCELFVFYVCFGYSCVWFVCLFGRLILVWERVLCVLIAFVVLAVYCFWVCGFE